MGRDFCSPAGNIQRWRYLDYWIDGWIIGTDSGSVFHGGTQIVLAALTTYLVCMPLILILGRSEGHIWEVPFWRFSLDIACCSSKAVSLPASIRFLLR